MWSGGADQFGFGLHEDGGEHASNQVQHALLSQRADSPSSLQHNVNLLAGHHSTQGHSRDTAAREAAAAAENTSTAPPTTSKTKFPNWYLRNKARAASNREAVGGEVGKYPWMQVGVRTTEHPRLDAGYMDPATGQEVKSGYTSDLDALERDMHNPSPHFAFYGKQSWVLVQEDRLSNGTVVTKFLQEVSKEQMEGVGRVCNLANISCAPTQGRTCVKTSGMAMVAGAASSSRGAEAHAVTLWSHRERCNCRE
jgi:hypothetical protein